MYETVIGLEIHSELDTRSKAFCSCSVSFGEKPNTHVCPVCMGLPGAMPKLNGRVVEYAVKTGLATSCSINHKSYHARKNYFYPDLPKGYQISQSDVPLCVNGFVEIEGRKIRINRIHIEEDAGKLIHAEHATIVDYNRAGVPLIEIVTEPDIRSAEEAKLFLDEIRNRLLYTGISKCRMQEGNLRCDVNVSVRKKGEESFGERCEMKNVNSFSAVVRCIEYEVKRQMEIINNGGWVERETRKWDDEKRCSIILRKKEEERDYRYFPEPDLPPVIINDEMIEKIRGTMPEMAHEKEKRYIKDYGLSDYVAKTIASEKEYAIIFDEAVSLGAGAKICANLILGDVARIVNERGFSGKEIPFAGKQLFEIAEMLKDNMISYTAAGKIIEEVFDTEQSPFLVVKEKDFTQISDRKELRRLAEEVLSENKRSVADYKNGKTNALGYLTGQCMKKSMGRANPKVINELLKEYMEDK
ncbi:MAG: Asp-tRNA(Asn)/Glu-tRNA(Gln) amidotransferase subunit GatB [Clostridia bacterium]|nr:Asp-tRNA(Asn)/Glu-tRNA(Gln) amidotransferase subunit GatB [Clostridia bacterium]